MVDTVDTIRNAPGGEMTNPTAGAAIPVDANTGNPEADSQYLGLGTLNDYIQRQIPVVNPVEFLGQPAPGATITINASQVGTSQIYAQPGQAMTISNPLNPIDGGQQIRIQIKNAAGGALDTTTLASFLAATTGFVTHIYDQTGNGYDLVQATTGLQPGIALDGTLGKWVITLSGSQHMNTAGVVPGAVPTTLTSVFSAANASFTDQSIVLGWNGANSADDTDLFVASGPPPSLFIGGDGESAIQTAATPGAWHSGIGITNSGNSSLTVDGIVTSGFLQNPTFLSPVSLGYWGGTPTIPDLTGSFAEGGIWPVAFAADQIAAMTVSQQQWWNFGTITDTRGENQAPASIVPAPTAYWGLRGYKPGFTGRAITVRRASDSATMDINILATASLGAITWGSQFRLGASWTEPAAGYNRSIEFFWDPYYRTWTECGRTAADVAN